MRVLMTKNEECIGYVNELTHEMDSHLVFGDKYLKYVRTYVYKNPLLTYSKLLRFPIRYSGTTRGSIIVDSNYVIQDIILFKDEFRTHEIYKDDVFNIFDKYIGLKLVFN